MEIWKDEANSAAKRAARRYVESICIPEVELAPAAGIDVETLDRLRRAHCVPNPTYLLYACGAIRSAAGELGHPEGEARAFYGPALRWWLRRAAEMAASTPATALAAALRDWLAADLCRALRGLDAAHANGWGHVVSPTGAIDAAALATEVATIWDDWMAGAWAICLREFDGHHLVTKEAERARIARLTGNGESGDLDPVQRLALLDAVARLDSVLLPFAPHERPQGTPGRFIDGIVSRYRLGGYRPTIP